MNQPGNNTELRLCNLEKSLNRWRATTVCLLIVVGAMLVVAAGDPPDWSRRVAPGNNAEFDVVTAKVVRVVSQIGTPVVNLTANARGDGMIALASGIDTPTVLISADEKQRGLLALLNGPKVRTFEARADADGHGVVTLRNAQGGAAVEFSAAGGYTQVLRLKGPDGTLSRTCQTVGVEAADSTKPAEQPPQTPNGKGVSESSARPSVPPKNAKPPASGAVDPPKP